MGEAYPLKKRAITRRERRSAHDPRDNGASYSSRKRQNNDDDQNESEPAAWVVSPAGTVGPRRQRADQQQNQNNNQNGREHDTFSSLFRQPDKKRYRRAKVPRQFPIVVCCNAVVCTSKRYLSARKSRHCEERSDEAIQSGLR
jgi:hypothetical protein